MKVGRVCPCIFPLCIRHLPDDGWSGPQKQFVVCVKGLIYQICVDVFGRTIKQLLRIAQREFFTQMAVM